MRENRFIFQIFCTYLFIRDLQHDSEPGDFKKIGQSVPNKILISSTTVHTYVLQLLSPPVLTPRFLRCDVRSRFDYGMDND
jgi:hypothetical protein